MHHQQYNRVDSLFIICTSNLAMKSTGWQLICWFDVIMGEVNGGLGLTAGPDLPLDHISLK